MFCFVSAADKPGSSGLRQMAPLYTFLTLGNQAQTQKKEGLIDLCVNKQFQLSTD